MFFGSTKNIFTKWCAFPLLNNNGVESFTSNRISVDLIADPQHPTHKIVVSFLFETAIFLKFWSPNFSKTPDWFLAIFLSRVLYPFNFLLDLLCQCGWNSFQLNWMHSCSEKEEDSRKQQSKPCKAGIRYWNSKIQKVSVYLILWNCWLIFY